MVIPEQYKNAVSNSPLILGTRGSLLALCQANFIKSKLEKHGIKVQIKIIKTKGDKILDAPLSKIGGKGLFTKELERELLDCNIDFAVHSLKDVPVSMEPRLILCAITRRLSANDCFVSYKYENLAALPKNSRIGTTSLRRAMQIKRMRPDLDVLSLRGNIQTRLQKLHNGEYDSIVLAHAALLRLGLLRDDSYKFDMTCDTDIDDLEFLQHANSDTTPISDNMHMHIFNTDEMIPAMGQGALGIQCRDPKYATDFRDHAIAKILESLNHYYTERCCNIERAFITLLNGGCQSPIGVYVKTISNDTMTISCIAGNLDGSRILSESREFKTDETIYVLQDIVNTLKANGIDDILHEVAQKLDKI